MRRYDTLPGRNTETSATGSIVSGRPSAGQPAGPPVPGWRVRLSGRTEQCWLSTKRSRERVAGLGEGLSQAGEALEVASVGASWAPLLPPVCEAGCSAPNRPAPDLFRAEFFGATVSFFGGRIGERKVSFRGAKFKRRMVDLRRARFSDPLGVQEVLLFSSLPGVQTNHVHHGQLRTRLSPPAARSISVRLSTSP
jgi:hypothetical protein